MATMNGFPCIQRGRVRCRLRPGPNGDRGSMALLLLVVIVGALLSAMLVPMVITQDRSTTFDKTRVQALDAAQAGIDVMLGLIRGGLVTNTAGSVFGNTALLPCFSELSAYAGQVVGATGATYAVSIQYYTARGTPMTCTPGSGTSGQDLSTGPLLTTPSYALISSKGTAGAAGSGTTAGRTLTTKYVFKTISNRIPGGQIQLAPAGGLCMDMGSSTLMLQTCSVLSPAIPQQLFTYRSDLTIQLVSSSITALPYGSCLTPMVDKTVQLNPCAALNSPIPAQQWIYTTSSQFQGSLSGLDVCMSTTATTNTSLTLGTCSLGGTWLLSPTVGAGSAAPPQLMNYSEFGLCLDVNDGTGNTPLTDNPCQQSPSSNAVAWNQNFVLPTPAVQGDSSATGQIYVTHGGDGNKYCLTSPGGTGLYATLVVSGPTATLCASPITLAQTWTVYTGAATLPYAQRFQIADQGGRLCLGLIPSLVTGVRSTIDVETCTGATDQKWNANYNALAPGLQNTTGH